MVIALYGIALAMVVGGAVAVVQGAPLIRLESGWTMVIAGAIVAASGAVLGGIAASVGRLGRIERELGRLRERMGRLDPATAAPLRPAPEGAALEAAPAPADSRSSGPAVLANGAGVAAARPEPRPGDEGRAEPVAPPARSETERAVLTVADLIPDPAPAEALTPAPRTEAAPRTDVAPRADAPPMAPAASRDESPDHAAAPPAPPPPTATVIGTYSSGGNSYVMFSDGSIEATTPDGLYRFQSLDELKEFIASGGEKGEAAPA